MAIDHSKLWAEGKYVDLWTIPHILAGVLSGGYLYWLNTPFWLNILITLFIIIGWEFFELYALNVHEHLSNKIMDVVTGVLGFLAIYSLIIIYSFQVIIPYLIILTIIYILLNGWGFLAYKRRKLTF